jgi:hypothetical protein
MAILLTNENNAYKRLILENSYIDIYGLHAYSIIYLNKSERDKEKARESQMNAFLVAANNKFNEINQLDHDSQEYLDEINIFGAVEYILKNFERRCYKIVNLDVEELNIDDSIFQIAESYGFNRI